MALAVRTCLDGDCFWQWEAPNAITSSSVKAEHTHLQRGLEILLVGEVGRGSGEFGGEPHG